MPLIKHHVIGGKAVLPTVYATAWMASAAIKELVDTKACSADQLAAFSLVDYKLFNGISLTATETQTLLVEKEQVAEHTAQIISLYSQDAQDRKTFHYRTRVEPLTTQASKIDALIDLQDMHTNIDRQKIYDEILFHTGPLQGIEKVLNISAKRLTLLCRISPQQLQNYVAIEDLPSNPLVDDLALQAMCIWPQIQFGYPSLPSKFDRWNYYKKVPVDEYFYISLFVVKSSALQLSANIKIHDQQGRIYSEILNAAATMSKSLVEQFKQNRLIH